MQHHFPPSKLAGKIKENGALLLAAGSWGYGDIRQPQVLPVLGSPGWWDTLNIINATLPKGLHTQTNALWHLLLSWGSKDGEKDLKIATQCWLSRQQDPSRMHHEVLCLTLGGDGRGGIANADATLGEPTFFSGRQGFGVWISQGRIPCLGPKEQESSKILISVNKRKSCGK